MSKKEIPEEEIELFRQAMKSVTPLKRGAQRVADKKKPSLPQPYRVRPKEVSTKPYSLIHLSDQYQQSVKAEAMLYYNPHSLPKKQFRLLKTGSIPWQARLDLHGLRPDNAREALCHFLNAQIEASNRCVLIIHGKGGRRGEEPILKNLVNYWLQQFPQVLAFHSAHPKDGGTGALYVLLKKNSL